MWHKTCDMWHVTCDMKHAIYLVFCLFCLFLFVLVSMLLSAHVKRFRVSHMQDFSIRATALTCDTWHLTPDTLHMTCDTWHSTCDTWHIKRKRKRKRPFLSVSVRFSISATIPTSREIQCLRYAGYCQLEPHPSVYCTFLTMCNKESKLFRKNIHVPPLLYLAQVSLTSFHENGPSSSETIRTQV